MVKCIIISLYANKASKKPYDVRHSYMNFKATIYKIGVLYILLQGVECVVKTSKIFLRLFCSCIFVRTLCSYFRNEFYMTCVSRENVKIVTDMWIKRNLCV